MSVNHSSAVVQGEGRVLNRVMQKNKSEIDTPTHAYFLTKPASPFLSLGFRVNYGGRSLSVSASLFPDLLNRCPVEHVLWNETLYSIFLFLLIEFR